MGFSNIAQIFKDPRLANSYLVTIKFVVGACVINNLLGILLAMGVNRAMPGVIKYLLRTALFFPVLTTSASLAVVWQYLLSPDRGVYELFIGRGRAAHHPLVVQQCLGDPFGGYVRCLACLRVYDGALSGRLAGHPNRNS